MTLLIRLTRLAALGACILLILLLAGCSQPTPAATTAGAAAAQRLAVSVAQASLRNVPAAFEENGTFAADETSDIAPLVAGRVFATPVNVGDFVKQGQVVCELDHRDAQLKLDQARAQLDQATSAHAASGIRASG